MFCLFIYIKKPERHSCHLQRHSSNVCDSQAQSQELGSQLRSPTWAVGTQLLDQLAASQGPH